MGYNNSSKAQKRIDTSDLPHAVFKPLKIEKALRREGSEEFKNIPSRVTPEQTEEYWG